MLANYFSSIERLTLDLGFKLRPPPRLLKSPIREFAVSGVGVNLAMAELHHRQLDFREAGLSFGGGENVRGVGPGPTHISEAFQAKGVDCPVKL